MAIYEKIKTEIINIFDWIYWIITIIICLPLCLIAVIPVCAVLLFVGILCIPIFLLIIPFMIFAQHKVDIKIKNIIDEEKTNEDIETK